MDLPIEDGAATFDTYADVVCAALSDCNDDVVVVGHSQGGLVIPLVAARRSVRHLVYLCALVPAVGCSLFDQVSAEPDMLNPIWVNAVSAPGDQMRTEWVDRTIARKLICGDCDDAAAEAVLDRLRPQSAFPDTVPFSLAEFPAVRSTYVICRDDEFVSPEWSRRVARDRLGADVFELPGRHSPLLSRPSAVAEVLLRVAAQ